MYSHIVYIFISVLLSYLFLIFLKKLIIALNIGKNKKPLTAGSKWLDEDYKKTGHISATGYDI